MARRKEIAESLAKIADRLDRLDRENELIRTVLIVKEPETVRSVDAYEGLRKQVIASNGERRSHLAQLTSIAVALSRATSLDDLQAQADEWLFHAGIARLYDVPSGQRAQDLFEDLDGGTLEGAHSFQVVEPAYVDTQNGVLIRLGRGRRATPAPPTVPTSPSETAADDVGDSGSVAPDLEEVVEDMPQEEDGNVPAVAEDAT